MRGQSPYPTYPVVHNPTLNQNLLPKLLNLHITKETDCKIFLSRYQTISINNKIGIKEITCNESHKNKITVTKTGFEIIIATFKNIYFK